MDKEERRSFLYLIASYNAVIATTIIFETLLTILISLAWYCGEIDISQFKAILCCIAVMILVTIALHVYRNHMKKKLDA